MKHTPGPWEVSADSEIIGSYSLGIDHEEMERIYEGYDISDEEGDRRERESRERNEANRLLIQATTDLLESCQYIDSCAPLADDRFDDGNLVTITITEKGLRDLRRAIAKQEGR